MRRTALMAALVLVSAAGCGKVTHKAVPRCRAGDLHGTFQAVPGSAGAGNIVYELLLRNRSAAACYVTGLPGLKLVDAQRRKLPTNPIPAHDAELAANTITLAPGRAAIATARFSPDVPGKGEQHPGRCEPVAHDLRVSLPGGSALTAAITPPTSVCESGTMTFSELTATG